MPEAQQDLLAIRAYISETRPSAAASYEAKFRQAFELLLRMPNAGHVPQQLLSRAVRVWTVRPYLIIYHANKTAVNILRVLHGAQDLSEALDLPESKGHHGFML